MSHSLYPHPELPNAISGVTGLMVLALFGWLNQLAQRESQDAMLRAFQTKEEGQANLVSLIENTNDYVYSLNQSLCLRCHELRGLFGGRWQADFGRDPVEGEAIGGLHEPGAAAGWLEHYRLALGWRARLDRAATRGCRSESVLRCVLESNRWRCPRVHGIRSRHHCAQGARGEAARCAARDDGALAASRHGRSGDWDSPQCRQRAQQRERLGATRHRTACRVEATQPRQGCGSPRQQRFEDLGPFLAEDAKGKQLPRFLALTGGEPGRGSARGSLRSSGDSPRTSNTSTRSWPCSRPMRRRRTQREDLTVGEVVEDALALHTGSLGRFGIRVTRKGAPGSRIHLERHSLMPQILVNPDRQRRPRVAGVPAPGQAARDRHPRCCRRSPADRGPRQRGGHFAGEHGAHVLARVHHEKGWTRLRPPYVGDEGGRNGRGFQVAEARASVAARRSAWISPSQSRKFERRPEMRVVSEGGGESPGEVRLNHE